VAGVFVFLPALRAQFFLDDFLHNAMVQGTYPVPRSPFNLYDFVGDDNRDTLVQNGLLPWWAHPELKIRFFRPLASMLLWVDHRIFGMQPLVPHLHSFVWWIAAVLALYAFHRRLFSPRVTLFATVIFALSPCHMLPIAWLANREALISITFGTCGLLHYVAFREGTDAGLRRFGRACLAALCFAFALLGGGEYALAFGGYIVAFDLTRRESIGRRAISILPFVLPAALYLAVRFHLHYGTAGSGFYADPIRDPAAYLALAPWRFVAQLADGWLTLGTFTWREGWERYAVAAIVIVSAAFLVRPIKYCLGALEEKHRRTATWLLLGSFIALVPTLAVVPAMRLLGISMIGISAAVAIVLDRAWFYGPTPKTLDAQLTTLAAIGLGFTQLVHGPGMSFLTGLTQRNETVEFASHTAWLRDRVGDATKANIAIVRGLPNVFFVPFALEPRGRTPGRYRVLSQAGHVLALRTGERSLELAVSKESGMFPAGEQNLYRSPENPLTEGMEISRPGMKVTVLEPGEDGPPRRLRFVFDDDPSDVVWISDGYKKMVDAPLPKIGRGAPFDP
jgi:hypothetical protein